MKIALLAACAALVAAPAIALADPPGGKPPSHAKNGRGVPPGLAKKPYGLPPGQAKKIWRRGERLPTYLLNDRSYSIGDPYAYRLPPAPADHRWVGVEDNAYLANARTGLIARVIADVLR